MNYLELTDEQVDLTTRSKQKIKALTDARNAFTTALAGAQAVATQFDNNSAAYEDVVKATPKAQSTVDEITLAVNVLKAKLAYANLAQTLLTAFDTWASNVDFSQAVSADQLTALVTSLTNAAK